MFWEMNNWLTTYVKNAPNSTATANPKAAADAD
jgi:hypothetical protein